MLFWLSSYFVSSYSWLNVFKYLTFRLGLSIVTSLAISLIISPMVIRYLKSRQSDGQPIRDDGPESHFVKKGTPTMGGIMILLSGLSSTLLWSNLSNYYILILIFVATSYGVLGFYDDYLKVIRKDPNGLKSRYKIFYQIIIALVAILISEYYSPDDLASKVSFPFFKDLLWDLGWFFPIWGAFVVVGSSNAVNLTDGLDGLATAPVVISLMVFVIISYLVGNVIFANYLHIPYVPNTGELVIFSGAFIGSCLGFLWYNASPASVFMGDTGSLSLGGILGMISVISKNELVWAITGGLFVLEAISVILQVASFKLSGKRIFLMAPIHHHFEKKGWSENKVVIRFWIIAAIFALLGLSTLKLR